MQPRDLNSESFAGYPPEARKLVVEHLDALRLLPLSFVPALLREVIEYDFKFPSERKAIDGELNTLGALTPAQRQEWFQGFEGFTLSSQLEQFDWINRPAQFTEQLSAHLWSTHHLDAYRQVATAYGTRIQSKTVHEPLPIPRLGIAVIGQGATSYDRPLFRNLRSHGTYFNRIKPNGGLGMLLGAVADRAESQQTPYAHWYVDGGEAAGHSPLLVCVSYRAMESARETLLKNMQSQIQQPGMGPEELRTRLARMTPSDLGMQDTSDPVLSRFKLKILTEGSGTQIFSTSFAQWTAREALRRAEPLTLMVRFTPRQRQRPMNELLSDTRPNADVDASGSLVDADMAAYYHWINQQRLPGYERSSFLVWFEDHNEALAIGPAMPRGASSSSETDLSHLVQLATS
jgi:hypothetical protein